MTVNRLAGNPIIKPSDVKPSRDDFKVVCVFNSGVTRYKGEVLLLLRVAEAACTKNSDFITVPYYDHEKREICLKMFKVADPNCDLSDSRYVRTADQIFLTSMSHFRIARSRDGINFEVDDKPAMVPVNIYEMYGIEDPRITQIDQTYYINYSAISPISGVTTCLASTKDWKDFHRYGVIFTPDNKDVAIFPEKINDKYYALNRPVSAEYNLRNVWISESSDLVSWGNHRHLFGVRKDGWDNGRIGCSAVPFLTERGWLEIYHGASKDNRYCLGATLLNAQEPWKVLARSECPLMSPEADYEIAGFFGNVVFSCGVLIEDDIIKLYYGAADTCIAYAEISLNDIFKNLQGSM